VHDPAYSDPDVLRLRELHAEIDLATLAAVEQRLLPVNALLGLASPGDDRVGLLAAAGFRVVGIEVPVTGTLGKVVVDVVLARAADGTVLVCEAKSGRGIDDEQARKYGALTVVDVVQQVGITSAVTTLRIGVVYATLALHRDTIAGRLEDLALAVPVAVLGASSRRVGLVVTAPAGVGGHPLAGLFPDDLELPAALPRPLRIDHESPADAVRPLVVAEVTAAMSRRETEVGIRSLTERVCPQSVLFGTGARNRLRGTVDDIARHLPDELSVAVSYLPRSGARDAAVLQLHETPETADPRGRTQKYQALDRRRARRAPVQSDGQFELLDELGLEPAVGPEDDDGAGPVTRHRPAATEEASVDRTELAEVLPSSRSESALRTVVLEAHSDDPPALLSQLDGVTGVTATEDAHLHRLSSPEGEIFADTVDPRFWSLHTRMTDSFVSRMVQPAVQRRRDLDRLWLPTQHLTAAWPDAERTGVHVAFDARGLDPGGATSATLLKLTGREVGGTLALLSRLPDAGQGVLSSVDGVQLRVEDPDSGHVDEAVNRGGTFVARGDSFALHQAFVADVLRRYRTLVETLEERRLAFVPGSDPEGGGELRGDVVSLAFSRPISDLQHWLDELLSSREPFRLWGQPEIDADGVASVEVVDLHVGQRLSIDVTVDGMRLYLPEGTCGNTVVRLVSNLQHRFDNRLTFTEPALQQLLEGGPVGAASAGAWI